MITLKTIKNKHGNNSRLLFTDTDNLMYEFKPKMFMKILVRLKKCLILVSIYLSQNIIMIQTINSLIELRLIQTINSNH